MGVPQVIQGTWEEIAAHAADLEGRDDLLLIVPARPGEQNGVQAPMSLTEAMSGYVGTSDYGDVNLSEDTSVKFTELLARKRRVEQQ